VFPFETPENALVRLGADWGYSQDPTVLVRCFIGRWAGMPGLSEVIADPTGRTLFIDYEAHRIGCEVDAIPALFAGSDTRIPPRWSNSDADRGVPGSIVCLGASADSNFAKSASPSIAICKRASVVRGSLMYLASVGTDRSERACFFSALRSWIAKSATCHIVPSEAAFINRSRPKCPPSTHSVRLEPITDRYGAQGNVPV